MTVPYSLYFHIPFCTHRCAYCDFNTYAGQEDLIPVYVEALCKEIRSVARSAQQRLPVHTLFFGGGTPSLLISTQFDQILETVHDNFDLHPFDASGTSETSLEANPGTVTFDSLRGFHQAGFNRVSFGVQSFHAGELRQLERIHNPFEIFDAFRWARKAGIDIAPDGKAVNDDPTRSIIRGCLPWEFHSCRPVTCSPPNPSPKATRTRSPTRFRTRCSMP